MMEQLGESRRPRASRLHNMSAPPTTVIRSPGPGGARFSRRIVFEAPAFHEGVPHAEVLRRLQVRVGAAAVDEGELRRRLDDRARALPLPPAAVVTDQAGDRDEVCNDLLSIMTVLSKSSHHVYLRDKEPNLAAISPSRRVVLVVPKNGGRP